MVKGHFLASPCIFTWGRRRKERKKDWKKEREEEWEFPGSPVVRTPSFHWRGPGFNPWLGNWDPTGHVALAKKGRETECMCSREHFLLFLRLLLFLKFILCIHLATLGLSRNAQANLPHSIWDLSSLTRDETHVPCVGRWILSHWTTREVPLPSFFFFNFFRKVLFLF